MRFIFLWFFFIIISKHCLRVYFKKCSFNSFLKILFLRPLPSCFFPILSSTEKGLKKNKNCILFSMDFNLRLRIIRLILISLHIFTWFMSSAYQSHFRTIVLIEEIYKSCHFRKHMWILPFFRPFFLFLFSRSSLSFPISFLLYWSFYFYHTTPFSFPFISFSPFPFYVNYPFLISVLAFHSLIFFLLSFFP